MEELRANEQYCKTQQQETAHGKNATDHHTAGEVLEVGSLQEALREQQK